MAHPVNLAAERLAQRRPVNLPKIQNMERMRAGELALWTVIWIFLQGPSACLEIAGVF